MAQALPLINSLPDAPNPAEIEVLICLLPADGDTGAGLNWSILHCIEASQHWPIWAFLEERNNEWTDILKTRLKNAGEYPPA